MLFAGSISFISSFIFETPRIDGSSYAIALFALVIIFGDLIVTRRRAQLSKKYSATIVSLVSIFMPFIVALHEKIFLHKPFSPTFFVLMIPAFACFAAFYIQEMKRLSS